MTLPSSGVSRHRGGPADRYGSRRRWTRPATVAGVAVLAVVAAGWVVWAALYHADPEVASRVQAFEVTSSREVKVTIAIERDPGTTVFCLIKAQAGDHSVVGEREVVVPGGSKTSLTRTYVVTTEREATAGVLDGCRAVDAQAARR
ncbi:MAG TPA: DUF4307 domain-containing protein [Nocardioidaceae bacterium]|nr:DUF4307 domain-containing protein [Nocardioidaceae bacterium]